MALIFAVIFATLAFVTVGCASVANLGGGGGDGDTIYVPEGGNQTIQQAVNNATAGDTIIVRDGVYTENIDVNKRLTIRSENGSDFTIVQAANSNDHVFEVTVDYVNISGFTVDGAKGAEWSKSGIYLEANYSIIANNNCSNTTGGIRLQRSNTNTIENNICSSNGFDGIELYVSNNNIIANNNCSNNHGNGIYFRESNSNNNTIVNNICSSNYYDGIALWYYTYNNTIVNNICFYNTNGIYLLESNNNIIANNNCSNNHGWYLFPLFKQQ